MDKEMRLACLKIAAETSKGPHSTVVEAADVYAKFIEKESDDKPVAAAQKQIKRKRH
jgi:hypothetical protein